MRNEAGKISSMNTVRTFLKVGSCSETLCNVINRIYDHPMEAEERAAMPFAGGIMQHGYQCGFLWGAALAAGAEASRRFGSGPRAHAAAVNTSREIVDAFRDRFHEIDCQPLIDTDWHDKAQVLRYFLKGGSFRCLGMAAKAARLVRDRLERVIDEEQDPSPDLPVSCAALLAQKLGMSDTHTVMLAGFAGGIGLSGSACGALGAKIWITALRQAEQTDGKIDYKSPQALAVIESFLEHTDFRFECEAIVGRKFESIADHTEHLRCGGCAELLEALAAQ